MLVSDILARARYEMRDTQEIDYGDAELLNYYNDAIHAFNLYLINLQHDSVIEPITITNALAVPSNYFKFAGDYPVYKSAGLFYIADGSTSIVANYYKLLTYATTISSTFPLADQYATHIVKGIVFWALNKHSFDLTQDKTAIDAIQATMALGMAQK